jgi:uridine kinase
VDGPDAAGKTTYADALAASCGAARVRADDYLAPEAVRYARGRLDPDGYYDEAFDLRALRAAVLAAPLPVVVDGVFLFRPELDDLWDVRVFCDVSPEEQWRRVVARDGGPLDDLRERYERRYRPAYDAYRARVRPEERADLVVRA